jgi:uncharacterized OsmC-like protein
VPETTTRICDCFPALRQVTAERERRYREDPTQDAPAGPQSTVLVKVTSTGNLNEEAQSQKSGRSWTISEPVHVGGLANAPTPLEYLLSGVLGCFAAVYAFYAAQRGVDYDAFEVNARADLDVRGHMMSDAPPSGFRRVVASVKVTSNAPREALDEVLALAMQGCPGIDTLRSPVQLEFSLEALAPGDAAADFATAT